MTAFAVTVADSVTVGDNLTITYTITAPIRRPVYPARPHVNALLSQDSWLVRNNPSSHVGRPVLTQRKDTPPA